MSGRQQGDRKVIAPAAAATGMATISGPLDTRLATLTATTYRRRAASPGRPGGQPGSRTTNSVTT
jgi:hypothetical protein